ncbi:MAG: hypothetical protein GWP91_08130 [Rhodobacterales bacterium]|nr:hypothetical protein [Rhodobacterales bacterium]
MSAPAFLFAALLACGGGPADEPVPDESTCEVEPVTWDNFARGFIQTQCLPCHTATLSGVDRRGAPPTVNYDTYTEVVAQLGRITARATGSTPTMPPAGGIPDEDRQRLLDWVLCGAPGSDDPVLSCQTLNVRAGDLNLASPADAAAFCASTDNAVGGDLTVSADVEVPCLCDLQGTLALEGTGVTVLTLPELRAVHGDLIVAQNIDLAEVSLPALTEIGGQLVLQGNSVVNVNLAHLSSVGGSLQVSENVGLTTFDVVRLRWVMGDFQVENNPELLALPTATIDEVDGQVRIVNNDRLTELGAFQNALRIGGDIVVADNDGLVNLDGFTYLVDLSGDIEVLDNASLFQFPGFQNLWTHAGSITVADNPSLERMQAFVNLHTTAGTLRIEGNPRLWDLRGLESLTDVAGLAVVNNLNLPSLDGLEQLVVVSGDFELVDNPGVTDVLPLVALAQVDGDLTVTGNTGLSAADIDARLLCLGVDNVGGAVSVSGNGP